jgi:L-alanine-DL-glutamate epimerase-like enolase superfamily enzyme
MAAGIFNIKLMKCGGVSQALKIADIAEQAKIDLFWGCNDEGIVSITAALHAAFACANTKYIDLDGSLDLGRDEVKGGFILKDGIMSCSDKPGLGVERI